VLLEDITERASSPHNRVFPGKIMMRALYLVEHFSDHAIENVLFARDVVIEAHGLGVKMLCESPNGEWL
jgi:hypothetical protein